MEVRERPAVTSLWRRGSSPRVSHPRPRQKSWRSPWRRGRGRLAAPLACRTAGSRCEGWAVASPCCLRPGMYRQPKLGAPGEDSWRGLVGVVRRRTAPWKGRWVLGVFVWVCACGWRCICEQLSGRETYLLLKEVASFLVVVVDGGAAAAPTCTCARHLRQILAVAAEVVKVRRAAEGDFRVCQSTCVV